MSPSDEIKNLPITLKAISLNIFIIPLWYISFYLFNNDFYNNSDNIILWISCIMLSIVSSTILGVFITQPYIYNKQDKSDIFKDYLVSVIVLAIILTLMISIFYSLFFLFSISINFYYYIIIHFMTIVLLYLEMKIAKYFKNQKNRNNNKKK